MHHSQSSITMMDLPIAQKKIIFRGLIATSVLIDVLSSVDRKSPEDIAIEFSEKLNEHMKTAVTDEDINKAIKHLFEY